MIEKVKTLASVEVLPTINAINVAWNIQIVEDGNVISENPHRCAYGAGMKEAFLLEVEGAENYVNLINWEA